MPTKETDGMEAKFYLRAMFSCQDDWVECRATSVPLARTRAVASRVLP